MPTTFGNKARIISPVVAKSSYSQHCLTYAFHMNGPDVGQLNMYVKTGSSIPTTPSYINSGSKGNYWYFDQITFILNAQINFEVVFEAVVGLSGSISMDDIFMKDGPCVRDLCDFENPDLCGYTNDLTASFNWTRNIGPTDSFNTGPSVDHTTLSNQGHFMFIESSFPQRNGSIARLLSPSYTGTRCLTFYYHMWGADIGLLNVLTKNDLGTFSVPAWSRGYNYGDQWQVGQVELNNARVYQIAFEGIVGASFLGDIALDDVLVEDRNCPPEGFCNFDSLPRLCTWENEEKKDQFDWEVGTSQTSASVGTGPSIGDHTFGDKNGHFAFIDTSLPRKPGDQAWLKSIIFPKSSAQKCLNFWYHMNGNGIGSLQINIWYENSIQQAIWRLSGDKGDKWFEGRVSFISPNMTYRIVIMGIRGSNEFGDIAIDDISFTQSNCALQPTEVTGELNSIQTTTTTTTKSTTTVEPVIANISCNFDNKNTCGWVNDSSANFGWSLHKGSTSSFDTGPSNDVSGGGYYIYVETSNRREGEKARIISPDSLPILANQTNCLLFYYHLYGDEIGELNVQLYLNGIGASQNPIWKRDKQHGNVWLKGHVTIPASNAYQNYRIVFEGIVGKGYRGDVAIDEITFLPNRRCPPTSEYGLAVTHYCDFEDPNLCGYKNDESGGGSWKWLSARNQSFINVPPYDHTYETPNGYFMSFQANILTSTPAGQIAHLETPRFTTSYTGSCVEIYYWAWLAYGTFNVYAVGPAGNNSRYLLFTTKLNQGNRWVDTEFEVPNDLVQFSLLFEAISATTIGIIAFDDVSIRKGACKHLPGDCNFEYSGFCSWENVDDDNFDWLLQQGPVPSLYTGPSIDQYIFGFFFLCCILITFLIKKHSSNIKWYIYLLRSIKSK